MPGTATVPAFSGSAQKRILTLGVIDASGDKTTQNFVIDSGATDIQVQALIDAYQAATQSSVYEALDLFVYRGAASGANATSDQRNSVKDGINMLFRDTTNLNAYPVRVVAPVTAVMDGDNDIPLLSGTELQAVVTAVQALAPSVSIESAQYTEHVERAGANPRVTA